MTRRCGQPVANGRLRRSSVLFATCLFFAVLAACSGNDGKADGPEGVLEQYFDQKSRADCGDVAELVSSEFVRSQTEICGSLLEEAELRLTVTVESFRVGESQRAADDKNKASVEGEFVMSFAGEDLDEVPDADDGRAGASFVARLERSGDAWEMVSFSWSWNDADASA